MRSDQVKHLVYHELAHTIHWRAVSDRYWIDEIQYTLDNNGYGDGTAPGAGRPAVVEAWANFLGPTVADVAYGIQSSPYLYQNFGLVYLSTATESSFIRAMERFDPNQPNDEVAWIPKGIMHDLRDSQVETNNFPVNDNVSNFTIPQIFNALQNDIVNPLQYRDRLMQQSGNNQQAQVNLLFTSYNIQ